MNIEEMNEKLLKNSEFVASQWIEYVEDYKVKIKIEEFEVLKKAARLICKGGQV